MVLPKTVHLQSIKTLNSGQNHFFGCEEDIKATIIDALGKSCSNWFEARKMLFDKVGKMIGRRVSIFTFDYGSSSMVNFCCVYPDSCLVLDIGDNLAICFSPIPIDFEASERGTPKSAQKGSTLSQSP